jgi:predicted protein tyrosine phosphatase
MEILVLNQKSAVIYADDIHKRRSAVISITGRNERDAEIYSTNNNNIVKMLRLKFNDTDKTEEGCMNEFQAEQVARFIDEIKNDYTIKRLIVHCGAGHSRSAGVAAAIMRYLWKDDSSIFNNKLYNPNMKCYRLTLEKLMKY